MESDHELEQRLAAARPEPPREFVRDLETSLFARPERQRQRVWVMRPTIVIDKNGDLRTEERRTKIYRQVRRCP